MSQMFNRPRTATHPASRRAYIAVILFSAIILIFFGVSEMTKKEVTVNQDGDVLTVQTHENTVEELLTGLDIEIKDQDLVEPSYIPN
ncbi:ubiquitin-like domain-containing protein [Bacillus sp. JCM 19041]|uniref:ubiquitin-like domain-containing protein n=1 Tax=Bacillus sp. JCM 19041 TaxID=1460637 RepID=UPI0006D26E2E